MKRIVVFCIFILIALVSCGEEQKPTVIITETSSAKMQENRYIVSYYRTLVSNDSVGSEWQTGVKYGEKQLPHKSEIIFDGEQLELVLYAVEKDDKKDDIGEKTITFSKLEIGDEETVIGFVEVVENRGAYINNKAVWKFSVTLSRLS